MRHSILLIIAILITQIGAAQSIQGVVFDKKTGEPLPFANVILFEDSIQIGGVTTSLYGEYSLGGMYPGTYDVEAVYVGYFHERVSEVIVKEDIVKVDIKMESSGDLQNVVILPIYPKRIQTGETLPKANQGAIKGKVFDEEMNEGLPFANVILLQKGIKKAETTTDLQGNYSFVVTKPGKYDVEVAYVGYPNAKRTKILVKENTIILDIAMKVEITLGVIVGARANFVRFNWETTPTTGATWKARDIKRFPGF